MHHFADDTNLLNFSSSPKKLNRLVNLDMNHLFVKKKLSECTED